MEFIAGFWFLLVIHMQESVGKLDEYHGRFVRGLPSSIPTSPVPKSAVVPTSAVPSSPVPTSSCDSCCTSSPDLLSTLVKPTEVIEPAGEKTPVKAAVGPRGVTAYQPQQLSQIGYNLRINSCDCGNRFVLYGVYIFRLSGKDKNMLSIGTPIEGQKIHHVTQVAAFVNGGVTMSLILYGNIVVYDLSISTTRPIQWNGLLYGERSIMIVCLDTDQRIILSGGDMTLMKRKKCNDCNDSEEHFIIHGIYGVNIIVPCQYKECVVTITQVPGAAGPPVDSSTIPLQNVGGQLIQLFVQEKCSTPMYTIDSPDSVSYRGFITVIGEIDVPPGQQVHNATCLVFLGESIDIKVSLCWNFTVAYDSCTGQIIVLSLQEPGKCYLMVLVAKPKCDTDFSFEISPDIKVKGVYGVHLLPIVSAVCPSTCLKLPPTTILNKAVSNPLQDV